MRRLGRVERGAVDRRAVERDGLDLKAAGVGFARGTLEDWEDTHEVVLVPDAFVEVELGNTERSGL